ncbi:MAG: OmpH family outer membrane protein [Bacteroidota bacterium]
MPMLYRFFLAALVALTLAPVAAQAQDVKIGYLDPDLLLARMPEARDVQSQLQQRLQADQQELATLQQNLAERYQDYEQNASVLNDEARQQREQELLSMQQDLQSAQQEKLQALQQQEAQLLQPLYDKLQTAIDQVAGEQGIAIVFSTRANDAPVVLYAGANAVDLTQPVAEQLGISLTAGGGGQ